MTPEEAHEAKGVRIRRTIGSEKLILLDPFLLLDHLTLAEDGSAPSEIGFPRHPHRGIETLTYVFAGEMQHSDFLGNAEKVGRGASQWMTAGRGIFHQEMVFADPVDGHESLQLWINLSATGKAKPAGYRAATPDRIPEVAEDGSLVRVVAGEYNGTSGPLQGIEAGLRYLDVSLASGARVVLPAESGKTAFAYMVRGSASVGEQIVESPRLVIFSEEGGESVTISTQEDSTRFVYATATPWKEPVLQYRSLVMSTVEQMRVALDDLERGTFA